MKNLKAFLIVVVFGATLAFPVDTINAGPFKRAKERRAAKRAPAIANFDHSNCPPGQCLLQVGTGGPRTLRINDRGGFEGQLLDQDFADYFAKRTGATPAPTPVEVPVETMQVDVEPSSVADAQAAVKAAEADVADKRAVLERAVIEQQQADARQALELQQQIDDLTARLKALEPDDT